MRAAVLIVNWNSWSDTIECIRSVLNSAPEALQLVVCDNDSTDGSVDKIRRWADGAVDVPHDFPPPLPQRVSYACVTSGEVESGTRLETSAATLVLIETGGNLGFAGGNNVGLRYILSNPEVEFVWLLNPDTVIEPGSIEAMMELAREDATIGVVGSRIRFYDQPEIIQAIGGGRVIAWQGMTRFLGRGEHDHGQWSTPVELGYITGCSMLVRTAMVRSVGLLDERYFLYSEEVDWCLRARRAGWRLVYCPESVVYHKEGRIVGRKSPRSDYYSVRSLLLLTQKFHPGLLPLAFLHSLVRCLLPKLVQLHFGRARAVLQAYRDFVSLLASGSEGASSRPPIVGGTEQ
jgi:GT2 family glycosyltransferase